MAEALFAFIEEDCRQIASAYGSMKRRPGVKHFLSRSS
jgi:hypothetical protein